MKKPTLQYLVLGVLAAWALIAQLTFSGFLVYLQARSPDRVQAPFYRDDYSTSIGRIPPEYRNSGLKINDEIVAFDGEQIEREQQFDDEWLNLRPGQTVMVTIRRDVNGQPRTLNVLVKLRRHASEALGWMFVITLSVFLPISCLLVGFYIAFARPFDRLAWITLAMLASFGQLAGSGTSWSIWSPWRELLLIYHPILDNTWPLWMLLFALYFPVPFPFIQKHRWVNWLLAFPLAALAALDLYGNFAEGAHIRDLGRLALFEKSASPSVIVLITLYVFAFFFLLGFKKKVVTTNDARRRLSVMIFGCSLALVPILPFILSRLNLIPFIPLWTLLFPMLIFFPITMAYVIVVQRAMDVRMVVRSGVQYAVASNGVKILRVVLIALVVLLTLHFEQRSDRRLEGIFIAALGIALIFTVGRLTRQASKWMDRRFFREAYNAEMILTELSSSVAGIRDIKTLLETIVTRIAASLHVPRIAVLLDRDESFQPAFAVGFSGSTPRVEFKRDTATVRFLQHQLAPSRVYFDDPQSWVHGVSQQEQAGLQTLDAQVLLPLTMKSRLLGLVSLGSKRSEVPYTKADLQLLSAVASQTGLALENAQLTESIRQEVAQRERLDRELEIAREVQQRLFPQKLPEVAGLDFAGYCRPALGVGGDYYDFIHLSGGGLGIAVGDVSGKGIAAALMMASLQASLRGQTIKPCETLSEMIGHINTLVYEASAENRYATFFYAQYDADNRSLRYVNAGHNPPIVCRKQGDEITFLRLEEGGTVVGAFPTFPYREGQIQLERGDVLVVFTDGISEAMNTADEEFDEERLLDALRTCNARSAAGIITYILEKVDGFTAGARQHDDMTVVAVRLQ
ncbi:MAG TPA: SpoIIE family protein phosphatase [Bryobacteraceae bacterium]|jgi:sigma-B regulation protein RsbU (phosphoserine phosphatase)